MKGGLLRVHHRFSKHLMSRRSSEAASDLRLPVVTPLVRKTTPPGNGLPSFHHHVDGSDVLQGLFYVLNGQTGGLRYYLYHILCAKGMYICVHTANAHTLNRHRQFIHGME